MTDSAVLQITVTISPPPALNGSTNTTTTTTTAEPPPFSVAADDRSDPNSVLPAHSWSWTGYTGWSECSAPCGVGLQVAERWCVLVMAGRVVEAASTVDPCLDLPEDGLENEIHNEDRGRSEAELAAGQPVQKRFRECEVQPCHGPVVTPHHSARPDGRGGDSENENEIGDTYFWPDLTGGEEGTREEVEFPSAEPGDLRFALCSAYDEKEFSGGRKFTWIPFQTGNWKNLNIQIFFQSSKLHIFQKII